MQVISRAWFKSYPSQKSVLLRIIIYNQSIHCALFGTLYAPHAESIILSQFYSSFCFVNHQLHKDKQDIKRYLTPTLVEWSISLQFCQHAAEVS